MKSISVYALTRNQDTACVSRLERQLSKREYFLKVREWELESMRELVCHLEEQMPEVYALRFFYSFQIPKLGKEFDLLQIKEDQIVNIELKSGAVSEEAIKRQLLQNRYYLAVQGKPILSYTYISSEDRLVRLTNHDHIVDADWKQLCMALGKKSPDYAGDIEELFQAELYLISPLTEPDRFLRKEYFLTSQQRDIERQILKRIRADRTGSFWFQGLPGTGKTLLLYDLAMKLSFHQKVCIIHCGTAGKNWELLHQRLRRIDFLTDDQLDEKTDIGSYSCVLVDEAHLLSSEKLSLLIRKSGEKPVIFSSDSEDMISPEEMDRSTMEKLEHLEKIQKFHLTNRIRTNAELSSFIRNMMHLPQKRSPKAYPHIEVVFAGNDREEEFFLQDYIRQGYRYEKNKPADLRIQAVRDTDCLVAVIGKNYYYDEKGYFRFRDSKEAESKRFHVRSLFHHLNQARESLALIVRENKTVYASLLELLQMSVQ